MNQNLWKKSEFSEENNEFMMHYCETMTPIYWWSKESPDDATECLCKASSNTTIPGHPDKKDTETMREVEIPRKKRLQSTKGRTGCIEEDLPMSWTKK